jgi:hypothetical protein
MNYFGRLFLFLCFIPSISSFAQVQSIVLDWTGTERITMGEDTYDVQVVKGFGLDNGQPFFAFQQKQSNLNQEVEILSLVYEKIPKDQQVIFDKIGLAFPDSIQIDAKVVTEAGQPLLSCYVLPIRIIKEPWSA